MFGFGFRPSLSAGLRLRTILSQVPADYVVTSDAEWNTVLSNTAATLSGKIIEIRGQLGSVEIDGKAMTTPLTIRSATASDTVERLTLRGTTSKIDFVGFNAQMGGWPANYKSCFHWEAGSFDLINIIGGTWRHGYGPSQVDFDRTADYPEYTRVDNVQTATTASQTFALAFQDAAATDAWIEFFNRGTDTVYVALGGAGVTATTGDTACPAGQRTRLSNFNPQTNTHFAVLAASGSQEVNARTEIGMSYYLADGFSASGIANLTNFQIIGTKFRDLGNGCKGIPPWTGEGVIMDCDFRRIYMDVIAATPEPGGSLYVLRNIGEVPFARSGIPENESGDARDPHGDFFQMYNFSGGTISNIFSAGNRSLFPATRTGVTGQGLFWSDVDVNPSYKDVFSINDAMIGGSTHGITAGESGFPVDGMYIYGATVISGVDFTGSTQVNTVTDPASHTFVGGSAVHNLNADAARIEDADVVTLSGLSQPTVMPNYGNIPTATTRAAIDAALTTGGSAAAVGSTATVGVIDWEAEDHTQVIQWDLLPSGAIWEPAINVSTNTVHELPLRRVLNRKASQAVSPGPGVEWRSVDTDGITEVQAWTTLDGTIAPGQYIQARMTSSSELGTEVTGTLTINGLGVDLSISTLTSLYDFTQAPVYEGGITSKTAIAGGWEFVTGNAGAKRFAWDITGLLESGKSYQMDVTIEADGIADTITARLAANQFLTSIRGMNADVTPSAPGTPEAKTATSSPVGTDSNYFGFYLDATAVRTIRVTDMVLYEV